MDIGIRQPTIYSRSQNLVESKAPLSNGANSFLAGSFVKRASSLMAAVATGDIVCLGWCPGPSVDASSRRPETFWQENYPVNPVGVEFLVNITDSSGHVGQGSSAPQVSAVTIGSSYGLYRWTSGTYNGMQALNVSETSNTLVQVTALGPDTETTDYNGLVRVKIIDSKIQA